MQCPWQHSTQRVSSGGEEHTTTPPRFAGLRVVTQAFRHQEQRGSNSFEIGLGRTIVDQTQASNAHGEQWLAEEEVRIVKSVAQSQCLKDASGSQNLCRVLLDLKARSKRCRTRSEYTSRVFTLRVRKCQAKNLVPPCRNKSQRLPENLPRIFLFPSLPLASASDGDLRFDFY